jgi:hypothetical protein
LAPATAHRLALRYESVGVAADTRYFIVTCTSHLPLSHRLESTGSPDVVLAAMLLNCEKPLQASRAELAQLQAKFPPELLNRSL